MGHCNLTFEDFLSLLHGFVGYLQVSAASPFSLGHLSPCFGQFLPLLIGLGYGSHFRLVVDCGQDILQPKGITVQT